MLAKQKTMWGCFWKISCSPSIFLKCLITSKNIWLWSETWGLSPYTVWNLGFERHCLMVGSNLEDYPELCVSRSPELPWAEEGTYDTDLCDWTLASCTSHILSPVLQVLFFTYMSIYGLGLDMRSSPTSLLTKIPGCLVHDEKSLDPGTVLRVLLWLCMIQLSISLDKPHFLVSLPKKNAFGVASSSDGESQDREVSGGTSRFILPCMPLHQMRGRGNIVQTDPNLISGKHCMQTHPHMWTQNDITVLPFHSKGCQAHLRCS